MAALKGPGPVRGGPEIFNSNKGSQFTSTAFTRMLTTAKIKYGIKFHGRYYQQHLLEQAFAQFKVPIFVYTSTPTPLSRTGWHPQLDH